MRPSRSPRRFAAALACVALAGALSVPAAGSSAETENLRVSFETTHGSFAVALDRAAAPATVDNFLRYVRDGHYEGTIFHRVIAGFMIQGGGYAADFRARPTRPPIRNEAGNGRANLRGTIAMARTPDPHSATAQFFINVADNDFLNHKAPTPQGWGYAAFGRVVEGMDVVDRIAAVETGSRGSFNDVPKEAIVIRKTRIHQDG